MSDAPHGNDVTPLDALLLRAASAGLAARREMHCATQHDVIGFVADSIETAILPRKLRVETSDGVCMTLLASSGKLLEITELTTQDPQADRFQGQPLKPDDLADVCAFLMAQFAPDTTVTVTTEVAATDTTSMLAGIPAADILRSVGLVQILAGNLDAFNFLLEGTQDILLALINESGDIEQLAEGCEIPAELCAYVRDKFLMLAAHGQLFEPEDLHLFRPEAFGDVCVAIHAGRFGKSALVMVPDALEQVAEFWADLPTLVAPVEG